MTQTTEDTSRSPVMAELLRVAIEYHTRDIWTALPGKIDKFDADKQRADVKPLVQDLISTEDGEEFAEKIPVIPDVRVVFMQGGDFYTTVPPKPGDFCILIFSSRSIDKYLEGDGSDANPEDFRTHDLTDAFALMGGSPFSKAISDFDEDAAVMGKEGGTRVRVAEDKIELGIKNATEQAVVNSKLQTELSRLNSELTAFKTVFDAHLHPGVTAGGASTGPPPVPFPAPGSPGATESVLVTLEK